jgi:exoribonuclease-2
MHQELAILWLGAQSLFKSRQETRVKNGQRPEVIGPPDPNSLPRDFHFTITDEKHLSIPADVLFKHPLDDSHWQVSISSRQRGSVTDLIVAEWMIFSNQTWGGLLANHELPAIFRAQQGWGPQRTRMQTTPCRHEGLGIENYAWCTSPLRRYSDLVNQWQLIAYLEKGVMAKLAAPFVSKDVKIMGICADFDATYTAYNMYQQIAEKYWCLKWLLQQGLPWTGRTRLLKDAVVRVEAIPLRLTVPELMSTPRGATVLVEITQIDLLSLNASVRVVEVLGDLNQVKEQDFEEELLIVSPQEILPTELVDVSQLTTNLVEIESSPEYQSPNLSKSFSLNEVVEFNQDDASIKKS